jgi:hypothetical protein
MKIEPTVGRIVWYWPDASEHINYRLGEPLRADICAVNSDGTVNLSVNDVRGCQTPRACVTLVQPDEPKPEHSFCAWMPYQKGQAAKTEALEAAAKSA